MRTKSILSCLLLLVPTGCLLAGNDSNFTYLALGDSIAFGFDPTVFLTNPRPTPASFTGYPEIVAQVERLLKSKKEVNAACPGETSASFLNVNAPDNGCNSPRPGPPVQPPFKLVPGLHTPYSGSQVDFAVAQLASNQHINLVTLSIGGNDLLIVEQQCAGATSFPDCVNMILPGVLQTYEVNLAKILGTIRAHYQGTLVLVNNYSVSPNPLFLRAVGALNQVMTQVGTHFGTKFADAFTAFQIASALNRGDPCASGLLILLSPATSTKPAVCDVHPSPLGRNLIAGAVLFAIEGSNNNSEANDVGEQEGNH